MFRIRKEQMQAFQQASRDSFENEMVAHGQKLSPQLSQVLGEDQLRVAVKQAISRAEEYELTLRGPVRLFVELAFMFGSEFHNDPLYPWASTILQSSDAEMKRADYLFEKTVRYQQVVFGPQNAHAEKALSELMDFGQQELTFAPDDFENDCLSKLDGLYPQKIEFTGKDRIQKLIVEGRETASKFSFQTPRSEFLVVVLMFAFGHGCFEDPLYPWIKKTV